MPHLGLSDQWHKNAVVYALDVETYQDADSNGVGDFRGLRARLDYLAGLGMTCLWLLPFYPTPNRDNGDDITDYYGVDSRPGPPGDFVEFLREATARGIRVLPDLVVNHTSNEHPWFRAAESNPRSPFRDYYVWSEEPVTPAGITPAFPGEEHHLWTYGATAHASYWHRFSAFQPDLNTASPIVREEILKIMGYWLELGVSGFRVDAAPFVGATDGPDQDSDQTPREMRGFLDGRRHDGVLLAEADLPPDQLGALFGDGDAIQLAFNFLVNQYLFLALARGAAEPIIRGLGLPPPRPSDCCWANFLRNFDELPLDRLTADERDEVFAAFAPEPSMRISGRGIRRRLAPMLGGDPRRIALAFSLVLTLPGIPVLLYGDELGMGDDQDLPGRTSVRTPMQWNAEANAGFSSAPRAQVVTPVIDAGPFGYQHVNAAEQRRDPTSLLETVGRRVRPRHECPEIGWGTFQIRAVDDAAVLGVRYDWDTKTILAIHNLSDAARTVRVDAGDAEGWIELITNRPAANPRPDLTALPLDPYGYRWFRGAGKPM